MAKLQIKFSEIETPARTVQLNTKTSKTILASFNKEDYGEKFRELSGKTVELDDWSIHDLNKLQIAAGNSYDLEIKDDAVAVANTWKEITKLRLEEGLFNDADTVNSIREECKAELDAGRIPLIKVKYKGDFTNGSREKNSKSTFVSPLASTVEEGARYDLSENAIKLEVTADLSGVIPSYYKNIAKAPKISDDSTFGSAEGLYRDFSSLIDYNYNICDNVIKIPCLFQNCASLKEVEIPESNFNIASGLFKACTSLEKATLNSKNTITSMEGSIDGCESLKDLTINCYQYLPLSNACALITDKKGVSLDNLTINCDSQSNFKYLTAGYWASSLVDNSLRIKDSVSLCVKNLHDACAVSNYLTVSNNTLIDGGGSFNISSVIESSAFNLFKASKLPKYVKLRNITDLGSFAYKTTIDEDTVFDIELPTLKEYFNSVINSYVDFIQQKYDNYIEAYFEKKGFENINDLRDYLYENGTITADVLHLNSLFYCSNITSIPDFIYDIMQNNIDKDSLSSKFGTIDLKHSFNSTNVSNIKFVDDLNGVANISSMFCNIPAGWICGPICVTTPDVFNTTPKYIAAAQYSKLPGSITRSPYGYDVSTETVETEVTEEVVTPILDEEGNPTYDEEGNAITEIVTQTHTVEELIEKKLPLYPTIYVDAVPSSNPYSIFKPIFASENTPNIHIDITEADYYDVECEVIAAHSDYPHTITDVVIKTVGSIAKIDSTCTMTTSTLEENDERYANAGYTKLYTFTYPTHTCEVYITKTGKVAARIYLISYSNINTRLSIPTISVECKIDGHRFKGDIKNTILNIAPQTTVDEKLNIATFKIIDDNYVEPTTEEESVTEETTEETATTETPEEVTLPTSEETDEEDSRQ